MPHPEPGNSQPIGEMPLIAGMIDEALDDTRAHIMYSTTRPLTASTAFMPSN